MKPRRSVNKVFLHHSATDSPAHDNIETIRKWHVEENGWRDIGYHFFIEKSGVVHRCRGLEFRPAAQKGHNKGTIAICLSGKKEFTAAQRKSLIKLCEIINISYEDISFHGHKEVAATLCPAYEYKNWLVLDNNGKMKHNKLLRDFIRFFKKGD